MQDNVLERLQSLKSTFDSLYCPELSFGYAWSICLSNVHIASLSKGLNTQQRLRYAAMLVEWPRRHRVWYLPRPSMWYIHGHSVFKKGKKVFTIRNSVTKELQAAALEWILLVMENADNFQRI